ncbi:hypothetical protein P4S72_00130 [Vibrio sp. PP-XX7]
MHWYHTLLAENQYFVCGIAQLFAIGHWVLPSISLQVIEGEINEVAYIDVPLNQIMSEVEMIQLERHILFGAV